MPIKQGDKIKIEDAGKLTGTPYDDVYRTLQNDCRRWCIPVINEIFDKKLLYFIPFYIFCFEKRFREIETEQGKMAQLREDYRRIRVYLDKMCGKGEITEYEKRTIIDMSKKVLESIAAQHPAVREGVSDVMGGKVLDYEAKDILRQGISQGIDWGIEQGIESALTVSIKNMMEKLSMPARQAMEVLDIPESDQGRYLEMLNLQNLQK